MGWIDHGQHREGIMVKLKSGKEVELKPLNYLQKAELMDESVLYSARCKQAGSDIPISIKVMVKTVKFAGVADSLIEEMLSSQEDLILCFNEIWKISGLTETQKKS